MTELEKKCRYFASRYCRSKNLTNYIDDLANYLLLHEGKFKRRRAADFFREERGRKGTIKNNGINSLQFEEDVKINFFSIEANEQDHSWMLWDLVRKLHTQQRVMMFLHYRFGLTLLEIADIYGLEETRICQIIKESEKSLQRIMEEDSRREKQGARKNILSPEQGTDSFETSEDLS